jgi:hypothetical protein
VILRVEIDIDIPTDLIENNDRLLIIEDGIIKSIWRVLYEDGMSFQINSIQLHV